MLVVAAIIFFLAFATALFAFGGAVLAPGSILGARLRALTGVAAPRTKRQGVEERLEQAVLDPLSKVAPTSSRDLSATRTMMVQAGLREHRHLTMYYGIRVLMALTGLAAAMIMEVGFHAWAALVTLPLIGYMVPRLILWRMVVSRQSAIRLALPDALDLAVICVEAGLGLDQTILRVGADLKHVHPELSDEFSLVNLEMRAGKPRLEALRNLALRTGVDDMRSLVAILVQTDRFGTSVAGALRVHSDTLRTERRQRAEEAAAKTTIKMVPVLVFFVFPAMFVVSLGPAAIQIIRHLLPLVQK